MIGLLVLFMLALWLAAAIWIARRVARLIPVRPKWRPLVAVGLFLVVFLLPVADELAARPSFNRLCREGAVEKINVARIAGRTVRLVEDPQSAPLGGALIPIYHSHFEYRDSESGEMLGEYEMYIGEGGFLARLIRLPTSHPLTGTFFCAPQDEGSIPRRYGFVVLR
jgi:hypothetical protein